MNRLAILVSLTLAVMGCSDDADTADGGDPAGPIGGWSGGGLYACFASDGKLGVGDGPGEAEELSAGTWTSDGTITVQGALGTWSLAAGTLTLTLDCMGQGCGTFHYQRDASLGCN